MTDLEGGHRKRCCGAPEPNDLTGLVLIPNDIRSVHMKAMVCMQVAWH